MNTLAVFCNVPYLEYIYGSSKCEAVKGDEKTDLALAIICAVLATLLLRPWQWLVVEESLCKSFTMPEPG